MVPRAVRTRLKPLGELSRWLQHGLQSSQDGSKTAQGASKTPLIRLQDRPRTSRAQGAPKSLQEPPRRLREPPRPLQELSRRGFGDPKPPPRALQKRLWRLQDASKSSPEEILEAPSRLQELSRRAFQASSCWPAASSLWPASGLGGKREALTISIQFAVPSGVLDPERFDS